MSATVENGLRLGDYIVNRGGGSLTNPTVTYLHHDVRDLPLRLPNLPVSRNTYQQIIFSVSVYAAAASAAFFFFFFPDEFIAAAAFFFPLS